MEDLLIMRYLNALTFFLGSFVINMVFLYVFPPFHEYIHYFFARIYSPYPFDAIVCASFDIFKKNKNIVFFKVRSLKKDNEHVYGQIALSNDFLVYSARQIRIIAIMPSVIAFLCESVLNSCVLIVCCIITRYPLCDLTIAVFIVLEFFFFYFNFFYKKGVWNDSQIFKNPRGYKQFMLNERHNCGDSSFLFVKGTLKNG